MLGTLLLTASLVVNQSAEPPTPDKVRVALALAAAAHSQEDVSITQESERTGKLRQKGLLKQRSACDCTTDNHCGCGGNGVCVCETKWHEQQSGHYGLWRGDTLLGVWCPHEQKYHPLTDNEWGEPTEAPPKSAPTLTQSMRKGGVRTDTLRSVRHSGYEGVPRSLLSHPYTPSYQAMPPTYTPFSGGFMSGGTGGGMSCGPGG